MSLCAWSDQIKGEGLYPGCTLYQMIAVIQKDLVVNKIYWRLVEGTEFSDLKIVLDNVMQECTKMNRCVAEKQAGVISYQMENYLWENGIFGEDTPTSCNTQC